MVTEMGICEQENGIQPDNKKTLNIYHLGHSNHICNTQLLKMWSRVLRGHSICENIFIMFYRFLIFKSSYYLCK